MDPESLGHPITFIPSQINLFFPIKQVILPHSKHLFSCDRNSHDLSRRLLIARRKQTAQLRKTWGGTFPDSASHAPMV
jgi:hypothetical protein